jgi:hypothetical protein
VLLEIGKPEKVIAKDYLLNQRIKKASEEFQQLDREIRPVNASDVENCKD